MQETSPGHPLEGPSASGADLNPLRITFVCCSYPPEREPTGVMAAQLAGALHQHGQDTVMVIPFPNRPGGAVHPGYRRSIRKVENIDGVRVVRCPNWLIGAGRRAWNRILENVTFGISGGLAAAFERRPDVLLMEVWPFFATEVCLFLSWLRRVPVLYYVKDLYPEVLENGGLIKKGGILARLLCAWDRHTCMASKKVVVISDGMRDALVSRRGIPYDRVVVISDWIDENEFRPLPRDNEWRSRLGVPQDTFVALFAGTLGIMSGADLLVEAADRLRNEPGILLLCVGEGVLKQQMKAEAARRGLTNIRFEPFQHRSLVPTMHAASDVCLLTMRKECAHASMPSKLVSYMASGRPVICAALDMSDAARRVSDAGAGLITPPGNPDALAQAILHLKRHPEEAAQLSANARSYFTRELAFGPRYDQFVSVLREVASHKPVRSMTVGAAAPTRVS
jgi:colanic acid biosynthesis glycosyl transferase WcaI